MFRPKLYKKSGRFRSHKGVRLPRNKKFDTVIETKSNLKVRSGYEKIAVQFFDSHQIEFQYEPLLLLGGKKYRPDFFLPAFGLFVEICGYGHHPFYTDRQAHKELIYKKYNLTVIFVHYNQRSTQGSLPDLLMKKLSEAGINPG